MVSIVEKRRVMLIGLKHGVQLVIIWLPVGLVPVVLITLLSGRLRILTKKGQLSPRQVEA